MTTEEDEAVEIGEAEDDYVEGEVTQWTCSLHRTRRSSQVSTSVVYLASCVTNVTRWSTTLTSIPTTLRMINITSMLTR